MNVKAYSISRNQCPGAESHRQGVFKNTLLVWIFVDKSGLEYCQNSVCCFLICGVWCSSEWPCSPQQPPLQPEILPPRKGRTLKPPHRLTLSTMGSHLAVTVVRLHPACSSSLSPSWPSVLVRCCLDQAPPCPCSTSPTWEMSLTCWGRCSSLWVWCSWSPAWSGSPCSNRAWSPVNSQRSIMARASRWSTNTTDREPLRPMNHQLWKHKAVVQQCETWVVFC